MTEETVKTEQELESVIDKIIGRIEKNNFKVYIYCPPMSSPSGGMSVLFKHARILKESGLDVVLIYEPREDQKASYNESKKQNKRISIYEPFNPTWALDLTEGLNFQPLGEEDVKFNDGKVVKCTPLTLNAEDFIVIPEGFPNIMEKTAQIPCKRIVFAQSWYYILNAMSVGQKWQHFGIKDVISVSDGITQYLNAVMPGLNIKQYSQSIDRKLFKPTSIADKSPIIAYSAGRSQDAVIKTYNVIKTFYSFFPQYRWVRFVELKNLSREEFAERLSEAAIVLYTDEIAGFGTLPLEAMATGAHVVGWTPLGGKEYMNSNNGFWANNGDIFQLAELLGFAVEKYLNGDLDIAEVKEEYDKTLSQYTEEKEKEQLLNIYNLYKNERIEELRNIKQQQASANPSN
jgi:glycosyltransferase involved in cell wall biosynthesis